MAKRQKKDPGEIIREYIGINRNTFEVETLSETRGGVLYKLLGDGQMVSHPLAGRQGKTEALIVFGLLKIQEITPQFMSPERMKAIEQELQETADRMKAEKQG